MDGKILQRISAAFTIAIFIGKETQKTKTTATMTTNELAPGRRQFMYLLRHFVLLFDLQPVKMSSSLFTFLIFSLEKHRHSAFDGK